MIKRIFGLGARNRKKAVVKFGQASLVLRDAHLFELRGGTKADLCMVKEYISLFEHQSVLDIYQ